MEDRVQERIRLGWRRKPALSLVWGEAECIWHQRHSERPKPHQCAGCQGPLTDQAAMDLWDGASVHWDDAHGLDCLIFYGQRWRGAAAAGLAALAGLGSKAAVRPSAPAWSRATSSWPSRATLCLRRYAPSPPNRGSCGDRGRAHRPAPHRAGDAHHYSRRRHPKLTRQSRWP
jgi:hypothetical protein